MRSTTVYWRISHHDERPILKLRNGGNRVLQQLPGEGLGSFICRYQLFQEKALGRPCNGDFLWGLWSECAAPGESTISVVPFLNNNLGGRVVSSHMSSKSGCLKQCDDPVPKG
uniref:Uncharacterized protein n=1 Tax=Oryza meridionalis TaxID=40149 RepID=A0A0E0DC51_9ORYZ